MQTFVMIQFKLIKQTTCSSDRYIINWYCLAVQSFFYGDVVECRLVTQTECVRFPAAALVIRIF